MALNVAQSGSSSNFLPGVISAGVTRANKVRYSFPLSLLVPVRIPSTNVFHYYTHRNTISMTTHSIIDVKQSLGGAGRGNLPFRESGAASGLTTTIPWLR